MFVNIYSINMDLIMEVLRVLERFWFTVKIQIYQTSVSFESLILLLARNELFLLPVINLLNKMIVGSHSLKIKCSDFNSNNNFFYRKRLQFGLCLLVP